MRRLTCSTEPSSRPRPSEAQSEPNRQRLPIFRNAAERFVAHLRPQHIYRSVRLCRYLNLRLRIVLKHLPQQMCDQGCLAGPWWSLQRRTEDGTRSMSLIAACFASSTKSKRQGHRELRRAGVHVHLTGRRTTTVANTRASRFGRWPFFRRRIKATCPNMPHVLITPLVDAGASRPSVDTLHKSRKASIKIHVLDGPSVGLLNLRKRKRVVRERREEQLVCSRACSIRSHDSGNRTSHRQMAANRMGRRDLRLFLDRQPFNAVGPQTSTQLGIERSLSL